MRLTVRLFAAFRERAGAGSIEIELPEGATVADLLAQIAASSPALAPMLKSARPVLNQEFALPGEVLKASDEVALLPPVSGGSVISPLLDLLNRHNEDIL